MVRPCRLKVLNQKHLYRTLSLRPAWSASCNDTACGCRDGTAGVPFQQRQRPIMRTLLLLAGFLSLMASGSSLARDYIDNDSRATGYRDTDGDGVVDFRDLCLRTSPGTLVDARGCPARPVIAPPAPLVRSAPPRLKDLRYRGAGQQNLLLRSGATEQSVIMASKDSPGAGVIGETVPKGKNAPHGQMQPCQADQSSRAGGGQS